uniref:Uncharacterized protein n=1 Tax=Rhizophagus irregularis (strain DAOM 181602 / DAOM 197198 / MUCL 43194) TaxID=747089 RepID=U9TFV2_RHIID
MKTCFAQLGSFVKNGFLKTLFDKSPQAINKAQLLVEMFGDTLRFIQVVG